MSKFIDSECYFILFPYTYRHCLILQYPRTAERQVPWLGVLQLLTKQITRNAAVVIIISEEVGLASKNATVPLFAVPGWMVTGPVRDLRQSLRALTYIRGPHLHVMASCQRTLWTRSNFRLAPFSEWLIRCSASAQTAISSAAIIIQSAASPQLIYSWTDISATTRTRLSSSSLSPPSLDAR